MRIFVALISVLIIACQKQANRSFSINNDYRITEALKTKKLVYHDSPIATPWTLEKYQILHQRKKNISGMNKYQDILSKNGVKKDDIYTEDFLSNDNANVIIVKVKSEDSQIFLICVDEKVTQEIKCLGFSIDNKNINIEISHTNKTADGINLIGKVKNAYSEKEDDIELVIYANNTGMWCVKQ